MNATVCVHATMTRGASARPRPLTTANCVACVTAAPSDSANQFTRDAWGSDACPEASGAADGDRFTHVAGRVEQRDTAQHGGARAARESLDHPRAEPPLRRRPLERRRRDLARPVRVLEPADDL